MESMNYCAFPPIAGEGRLEKNASANNPTTLFHHVALYCACIWSFAITKCTSQMKQWKKKHSVFALSVCISRRCDTAEFCNRFRFNETTQKMVYLIRRSIWHCGWSFYNLPFHQLIVRVFICGAAFSSHFSLNRFFPAATIGAGRLICCVHFASFCTTCSWTFTKNPFYCQLRKTDPKTDTPLRC